MRELSLFSGYGGFSLGLKLAGIDTRTVMYVEWERYPQEILKARIKDGTLDDAPIWGDISTLDGKQLRGLVDIISAGFPCQPHSTAGQRRGVDDERNLWPETLRIINEVEPRYVILENVPGILFGGRTSYGARVIGELSACGYDVRWNTVGADDVGAPHRRKRWLCLGVAHSDGDPIRDGQQLPGQRGPASSPPPTTGHAGAQGRMDDPEHDGQSCAQEPSSPSARVHPPQGEIEPEQPERPSSGERRREDMADADGQRQERAGIAWTGRARPTDHGHMGDATSQGLQGWGRPGGDNPDQWPAWPPSPSDSDGWARVLAERPGLAPALSQEAERGLRGLDDGPSRRVDRLKAAGNGVVPAVVAEFLRRMTR